jgi:hypothetical protein
MRHTEWEFSTVCKGLLLLLGIGLFLSYILFQSRLLLTGPEVALSPVEVVQNERIVEIRGSAHNITHIYLNGRPIETNGDGFFAERVILENGYTKVDVTARDRYGRFTQITKDMVYKPATNLSLHNE